MTEQQTDKYEQAKYYRWPNQDIGNLSGTTLVCVPRWPVRRFWLNFDELTVLQYLSMFGYDLLKYLIEAVHGTLD